MAKAGSFSSRFPHYKLFLFLAVVITLPLTVFSANRVSTNTQQNASGLTCSISPTWSSILQQTNHPTSITYKFKISDPSCGPNMSLHLWKLGINAEDSSAWSFQYSGCNINHQCDKTVIGSTSTTVYLTVFKPSNAVSGRYAVYLRAQDYDSPVSTKNIFYTIAAPCNPKVRACPL